MSSASLRKSNLTRNVLIAFGAAVGAVFIYLLLFTGACGCTEPPPPGDSVTVSNGSKSVRLQVEIADEPAERVQGLTGRTHLPENAGMLFDIPERGPGFWMQGVPIPLDVAFIDRCGQIVHIAEMQPNTPQLHQAPQEYRFGLETNGGWYAKNGFKPGDKVTIPEHLKQPGCA